MKRFDSLFGGFLGRNPMMTRPPIMPMTPMFGDKIRGLFGGGRPMGPPMPGMTPGLPPGVPFTPIRPVGGPPLVNTTAPAIVPGGGSRVNPYSVADLLKNRGTR